ncbi:MAG: 30S ribosomal protein S8 [Bacteroidetes Order II. Incertae sedis bacterium]|jgi:small subunit ribosomal protein S8|nr:30S ribosomal protein S8 [Bacteroidetes Order II. bacterium]MBT5249313.1 30S ribosomal protein S8 [Bacteroidetes Order II. bacterium]MBT6200796.1 30S ribosomal protein S8 [Bacteroidetes Order II. bacterium]MBT6423736.1 30S ribosomal protein S8 [Bacteroidetes Order II. bacterium]MBT6598286.1 30S ribosomal protein S8 [Bacteroidetes Order II. bacterium]
MNVVDPVSDYLTRIRNAQNAAHRHVDIPASKLKRAMTQILLDKGYVRRFINIEDGRQGLIRVYLKYEKDGKPVIHSLRRASKPGLRYYCGADDLPRVRGGLGIAMVSTSRGVMTDKEARSNNIGGEVLAYVY